MWILIGLAAYLVFLGGVVLFFKGVKKADDIEVGRPQMWLEDNSREATASGS